MSSVSKIECAGEGALTQRSLFDLISAPPTPPAAPVPIAADAPVGPAVTEHCELELVLHFDNEVRGELLVSKTGDESSAVWLLRSQVQSIDTGRSAPATTRIGKAINSGLPVIAVNLPVWLAKEKGLM